MEMQRIIRHAFINVYLSVLYGALVCGYKHLDNIKYNQTTRDQHSSSSSPKLILSIEQSPPNQSITMLAIPSASFNSKSPQMDRLHLDQ